ncbi:MAG: hypothetical protein U1E53_15740 [Dongiaceae bacterium]
MPDINLTLTDLNRFAKLGDAELRATGQGAQRHIETREGSWGGRLVRNLKVNFGDEDRSQKKAEYGDAKRAVFDALVKEYGLDVARKAFVAGAGRLDERGHVVSSVDHPLTGRQISRMIERAEIERSGTHYNITLSLARLEALALHDDLEIASDGQGGLTATEGGVGGRALRELGATDDQGAYIESKRMVYKALAVIYGEGIARSVFLAVDGKEEDPASLAAGDKNARERLDKILQGRADPLILSSANRPLTGAQLREMLAKAEAMEAGTQVGALRQRFGDFDAGSATDARALKEMLDTMVDIREGWNGGSASEAAMTIRDRLIPALEADGLVPRPLLGAIRAYFDDLIDRPGDESASVEPEDGPQPETPSHQRLATFDRLLRSEYGPDDGAERVANALLKAFDLEAVRFTAGGGQEPWDNIGFDMHLEQHVIRQARAGGIPISQAARDLLSGLTPLLRDNPDVPNGLTRRVGTVLAHMRD